MLRQDCYRNTGLEVSLKAFSYNNNKNNANNNNYNYNQLYVLLYLNMIIGMINVNKMVKIATNFDN